MRTALALTVAAVLVACGGGEPPPAAGTPDDALTQTEPDSAAQAQGTQLVREVFTYSGGGRDPFGSLVSGARGADLRPLPEDLRLIAITYDAVYPQRSVAVVRDVTINRRHSIRVNDRLGRMLVTEIRRNEVVFTVEQFGVPETFILAMTRRQGTGGF